MDELGARGDGVDLENEDDRPTIPEFRARATSPDAITLPGTTVAPFFDVPTAAFFAAGERAAIAANDTTALLPEEEAAAWWAAQRRMSAGRWVAALMALCVALLAASALRGAPDEITAIAETR